MARAAAESGLPARAISGFARAAAADLGSGEDRFAYGTALTRLGRNGEAAVQFKLVHGPKPLAALAAYQSARALVRDGQIDKGRAALVEVARKYPNDTAAAASAFFLRADLASDDRGDAEARRLHRVVAARYPSSRFAPTSRFRAAMIALLNGEPRVAAQEFEALAERYPGSDETVAATYWAGRAWANVGDSTLARGRWQAVMARDPLSYYAALSARRLGIEAWIPLAATDSFPADPESHAQRSSPVWALQPRPGGSWIVWRGPPTRHQNGFCPSLTRSAARASPHRPSSWPGAPSPGVRPPMRAPTG